MTAIPSFTVLGSGPTVLMLHGIGGGHLSFAPQVETFAAAGYRAVSWDMPGYGRSPPIEPYTFKGLAESCATLIESLKCGSVMLIGHSMGGMVAQELVARRPELVDRLVLAGTSSAFGKPGGDWRREFITQRTAPLDAGRSMDELAAEVVPRMVAPGCPPESLRLARHCMAQVPQATYRRALDCLVTFDRRVSLPGIRVPTLLLAGELDGNAPAALMRRMADALPGSRYVELRGVGHLQNLEAPEAFDGAVLDFLAGAWPSGRA